MNHIGKIIGNHILCMTPAASEAVGKWGNGRKMISRTFKVLSLSALIFIALTGSACADDLYVHGSSATSTGKNSSAWGNNTKAYAENSTAFGLNTQVGSVDGVYGKQALAFGKWTMAIGNNSTAFGFYTYVFGKNSLAFGDHSKVYGDNSMGGLGGSVGQSRVKNGKYNGKDNYDYSGEVKNAIALGEGAWAKMEGAIALGSGALADTGSGVSGYDPMTDTASDSLDVAWKSTRAAISIGDPESNVSRQITGVAAGSKETDAVNLAQLKHVTSSLVTSNAVTEAINRSGFTLKTSSANGDLINPGDTVLLSAGKNATLTQNGSTITVSADGAKVSGAENGAITVTPGQKDSDNVTDYKVDLNQATKDTIKSALQSVKIKVDGTEANDLTSAGDTQNFLSGNNILLSAANGNITISSKDAVEFTSVKAGNKITLNAGGMDVGSTKITNLSDGEISADSKDAINGSQLFAIRNAAGKKTTFTGDDNVKVTLSGTDASDGDKYSVKLADILTIGTAKPLKINGTEGTLTGLTNLDWDGKTIVSGRAATEDQLQKAVSNLEVKVSGSFGIDDGQAGDTHKVTKTLGNTISITGGATKDASGKDISDGNNISTAIKNDKLEISLNKDVNLGQDGSLKAGNTTIDQKGISTNQITLGDTALTSDGLTISNGPSVTKTGIDGGNKKLTGVANGEISAASKDAINGSQLYEVKTMAEEVSKKHTTVIEGKGISVSEGQNSDGGKEYTISAKAKENGGIAVDEKGISVNTGNGLTTKYGKITILTGDNLKVNEKGLTLSDTVSLGQSLTAGGSVVNHKGFTTSGGTSLSDEGLQISGGPAITKSKIDMGGQPIHGVGAGTAPTDAVNVSQLEGITSQSNFAIHKLSSRINRVGAGAAALSALHPMDFQPGDKWVAAGGFGNYRNANAAAAGLFYRPNEDILLSLAGAFGGGENMMNAGISLRLGQGSHMPTTRNSMAREIKEQKKQIDEMKEEMNQQKEQIAFLMKEIEEMKKAVSR